MTDSTTEYRNITADERELLASGLNSADDWGSVFVSPLFDPGRVKKCHFSGTVYIGACTADFLIYDTVRLKTGLYNSVIDSCRIDENVVVRNVGFLSHYHICNNVMLFNINQMTTSDYPGFGNGVGPEGDEMSCLEGANENGGRGIIPFDSMIVSDGYLWTKYRSDAVFLAALKSMTARSVMLPAMGKIGENSVVKNTGSITDLLAGSSCEINGAVKIANSTVQSSSDEASRIGEGVILENSIIGYGSTVSHNAVTDRVVTGKNCTIKYGARVFHTLLGDNSTISCCEVLHSIMFPFHEQHHNNSFLIAATLMGQSNIAAGATIGSNHNSRSPDGEIVVSRGFWPGLCTNFKHNSYFAPFVLIVKGNYNFELNIRYPFALVSVRKDSEDLQILPGYWFMHNMFAMARNNYKFKKRDKRKHPVQHIETNYLAPDTVQSMLSALERIYLLAGAHLEGANPDSADNGAAHEKAPLIARVKEALRLGTLDPVEELYDSEVMKRYGAYILKPAEAVRVYEKMCTYFVMNTLVDYFRSGEPVEGGLTGLAHVLSGKKVYKTWVNLGGQIVPEEKLTELRQDIKAGAIESWDMVHIRYARWRTEYAGDMAVFALYVLETLFGRSVQEIDKDEWKELCRQVIETARWIYDSAYNTRLKDYTDPFRKMVYDDENEMFAVLGKFEDNDFLKQLKADTELFTAEVERMAEMLS